MGDRRAGLPIDRTEFAAWINGYEWAWRSPGTASLGELFTEDISYQQPWWEGSDRGVSPAQRPA